MSDFFKKSVGLLVVFLVGLAVGRFTLPSKVVVKEVVKTEIKEVEKKVTTTNTNKVILITTTKKPDGTVIVTQQIVDKSSIITKDNTSTDTKSVSNKETTKEYAKNQYSLRVMAGKDLTNFSSPLVYGAAFDRQFLGPITIGVFGFTNRVAGVSLGLNF